MPGQQFKRVVTIVVDGYRISDLDIEFRVDRRLSAEPNAGQFRIYNLDPKLRARFQKGSTLGGAPRVQVLAGYQSSSALIFDGDVRFVNNSLSGADWITTIEAGEAEAAHRGARASKSFGAVPLLTVVQYLASTFDGVELGNLALIGFTERVTGGWSGSGPSAQALDSLLKSFGYSYTIINNAFTFVRDGESDGRLPVALDAASGLLDLPEMGEKKIVKKEVVPGSADNPKRYVKFKCLLRPDIAPGRSVSVLSKTISGLFVCESATHTGSNFDNDYYTEVECFAK